MNSTSEAVNFECPKGFTKEDVQSQLYFEDLDDDSELWLVRVPNDMDPAVLENHVLSLNKQSEVLCGSDGKFYECFTEKCLMPNLCLALPHKESKTLGEIKKPFKGSVLVTDYVKVEFDTVIKKEEEIEPEKDCQVLEELDEGASVKKKSKSHKKEKRLTSNEDLDISFNLNLEEDEMADSSHHKSKKNKKKKSKGSDSLKVEQMSDADEFPNCKSQKV